jgi:hypothetical protein
MKVSDILESYRRPGRNEHPFTVELEHEYVDEAGDTQYIMVNVSGAVTITPDAFSTGDSPTDYDVEVVEATDAAGKPFPVNQLSPKEIEWVEDKAISQVTRNL